MVQPGKKKREKGAGSQVGGGGREVEGERERGELSRPVQERPSPPRRAGGPCLPPTPLCVPDDPAARAGVGGPVRVGEARRLEEGEALWSPFLGWDSAASTSLLGPLCLLASPGRAQAPGWLAGGRGCPTPRPHLAQTTAFRALADGGGTCSRAGPEFASCSGGRRPSQGAAGDAVGKESGKKEKEKREGESRRKLSGKSSGGEEEEEGSGAPCLARQPAGPRAGWARGAGTMCPRSPPAAAATRRLRRPRAPGCAGAPSVRVSAAGGCPARVRQGPQVCRGARGRGSRRKPARGGGRVDLPAAKTFIMGCTPEGLEGDLRCRQFSEVHAQMGNLPDLYTGACVVRQREKQLYLAGIPGPGSCLRCIIGNYEWKKVRVKGGQ